MRRSAGGRRRRHEPGGVVRVRQKGQSNSGGIIGNLYRTISTVFVNCIREGRITSKQADDWEDIARMSDDDFEALLAEWYPPGRQTQPAYWNDDAFNNPAQPVVGICWFEARAYCAWLSAQTGQTFRLPTEAEWEAAGAWSCNAAAMPLAMTLMRHAAIPLRRTYAVPRRLACFLVGRRPKG